MNVQKISATAQLPVRSPCGYDLFSSEDCVVLPGRRVVVPTGLKIQFPLNTFGKIEARSGLAVKHGVGVLAGVIEPGYNDEVKIICQNFDSKSSYTIKAGYRIATLIIQPFIIPPVYEIIST